MNHPIRVAILDDHQLIIDGYQFRLNEHSDIRVVATGLYGDDLRRILDETIDVLILDVFVPVNAYNPHPYPILHVIPSLLQSYPELSILVITMHNQPALIRSLLEAGASGVILKDDQEAIQNLGAAIRLLACGEIYFSRVIYQQIVKRQAEDGVLSQRQLEVLSLCAAFPDATSTELARQLGIANSTLRNLLSGAYLKLGVRNRAAAIDKARQIGYITQGTNDPGAAYLSAH